MWTIVLRTGYRAEAAAAGCAGTTEAKWLRRGWQRLGAWRQRRRGLAMLARLDPHDLKDLGFPTEHAVRQPDPGRDHWRPRQ